MKKSLLSLILCGLLVVTAVAFSACGGDTTTEENTEETTAVEETTAAETEAPKVVGIEVATPPTKTEYAVGETFDPTGMVVNAVYDNGTSAPIDNYRVRTTGGLTASTTVVQLSYSTHRAEVPVTVVLDIKGSGTKEDPYLIETAANFASFVSMMKDGESFKDMYIKQTADIDITELSVGVNDSQTFAGVYDGCGYIINMAQKEKDSVVCIFPTVTGVVANLGTTGTMSPSSTQGAGVVRKVGDAGLLFNVWSSVEVNSGTHTAGIAYHNCGKIVGAIYLGKVSGTTQQYPTSSPTASSSYGTEKLTFFAEDAQVTKDSAKWKSGSASIARTDVAATLDTINAALEEEAKTLGIDEKISIVKWTADRLPA